MRTSISVLLLLLLFGCKNSAQGQYSFDKMPIDTSKWVATDTIILDFNNDGIKDAVFVFDKYKALYRPNNVQTPVLFYLGRDNVNLRYIDKSEKLICLPKFEIKGKDNILIITQNGIRDDRNLYTCFLKFNNGEIIIFKETIVKIIEKSKVNEDTGDVITSIVRQDTLYNKPKNIPVRQYDFLEFLNNWSTDK